ncbi:heat shock 70 kDa protein-like isoform X2 [Acanthaster planci]|uniref:Heat shock 70 kDa protein-like isoform X2 n=1 Tax=Acanthaster planci TaxID=133434 RepID=A0A8B7ZWJ5_ACAPL|nr:heat shock 70 kDa protein-like isoform X2 [Acanthaster planci]
MADAVAAQLKILQDKAKKRDVQSRIDIVKQELREKQKEHLEKIAAIAEAHRLYKGDDAQRDRINAKLALESFAYAMNAIFQNENLKDKISSEDKQTILDKCKEVFDWLNSNQVDLSSSHQSHL